MFDVEEMLILMLILIMLWIILASMLMFNTIDSSWFMLIVDVKEMLF